MRGTFLIFLLQMAEANVEMHSVNENEDQLLMSDGVNVPEQNPHAPPRDIEHEHRRIRRMNRREREEREIARNRRKGVREDHLNDIVLVLIIDMVYITGTEGGYRKTLSRNIVSSMYHCEEVS